MLDTKVIDLIFFQLKAHIIVSLEYLSLFLDHQLSIADFLNVKLPSQSLALINLILKKALPSFSTYYPNILPHITYWTTLFP